MSGITFSSPGGDIIIIGDKVYSNWTNGSNYYLVETTLGTDGNPIATNPTKIVGTLPTNSFGLSADANGRLYGVGTNGGTNSFFRITIPSTYGTGALSVTNVVTNSPGSEQYYGLTSDSEYLLQNFGLTDGNEVKSTLEDVTLTVLDGSSDDLLTNGSDPDGGTLSISGYTIAGMAGNQAVGTPVTVTSGAATIGTITINSNGSYTFVPAPNWNGTVPVITYTVATSFDSDTDTSTLTITVLSVNDPPSGTDKSITLNEDAVYTMTNADFGFSDPIDLVPNTLQSIRISTLPTSGTLTLNGVAVTVGQEITAANVASGLLKWTPVADYNNTVGTPNFTFQVRDNGGTSNGGIDLDPNPKVISFNVTPVSDIVNDQISVCEDSSSTFNVISGSNGASADNFENTPSSVVLLGVAPTNGTLINNGNGSFTFTPDIGWVGTTGYDYEVTSGGAKEVGSVTINVLDNNLTVTGPESIVACRNTSISNITHITNGATSIGTPTGLPAGVGVSFSGNIITISGVPSVSGIFNYSIPVIGPCNTIYAIGTITVNYNTVTGPGTAQVCTNGSVNINHTTTAATGIGLPTGLPSGVTASWSANIINITGNPTNSGVFNYTIPLIGGCGTVWASGTITVNTLPSITGTTIICPGGTSQLTGTATPAVSNPWISNNPSVATINSSGFVNAISAGTATIVYTNSNGCSASIDVLVTTPIITGNLAVCGDGSTSQLTANPSGGTWSSSNINVATVDGNGLVTSISQGSATITYTLPGGCTSTKVVNVNAKPEIQGGGVVCGGSFLQLAGIASNGNHVFGGNEAVNFETIDLSTSIRWTTSRISGNIGYYGAIGIASFVGSNDSHNINGYMKHYATASNQGVTFPVGSGNDLRTLTIAGSRISNSVIATAWIPGNPCFEADPTNANANHDTSSVDVGVAAVSKTGQWDWQDLNNDFTGTVTVSIPNMSGLAADSSELILVGWKGGKWIALGSAGATGLTEGSLLSGTMQSGVEAIGIGTTVLNINGIDSGNNTTVSTTGTWSSSDTNVATVDPNTGLVEGKNNGTVDIIYTDANGCTAAKTITVNSFTGVSSDEICLGSTVSLAYPITGGVWSSSDTAIATVDNNGMVTGISTGNVVINYVTGSGCCNIIRKSLMIVPNPTISVISGNPNSCGVNTTIQLSGSGLPAVTNPWVSSNPSYASVSNTGLVTVHSNMPVVITYTNDAACTSTITIQCNSGACYKPAATGGTVLESKHGITSLGRAGTDNGNWPMIRKGAWTVLESKEKGFVINRVPATADLALITDPIEGMMVYDEEADCLKIFTTKDDNSVGWFCFNTQACPD